MLKDFINSKSNKFLTVTFLKNDGTARKINGRLNVKKYLKGGKSTLDKNEFFIIYSLKDKGYRAIRKDSILSIATEGAIIKLKAA